MSPAKRVMRPLDEGPVGFKKPWIVYKSVVRDECFSLCSTCVGCFLILLIVFELCYWQKYCTVLACSFTLSIEQPRDNFAKATFLGCSFAALYIIFSCSKTEGIFFNSTREARSITDKETLRPSVSLRETSHDLDTQLTLPLKDIKQAVAVLCDLRRICSK